MCCIPFTCFNKKIDVASSRTLVTESRSGPNAIVGVRNAQGESTPGVADESEPHTFFSHHGSASQSLEDTLVLIQSPMDPEKERRRRFEGPEEDYYRHIERNVKFLRGAFTDAVNRLCSLDVYLGTYTAPRRADYEEWYWEWRACDRRRVQLERCLVDAGLAVPKPYKDERDEQQGQLLWEHLKDHPPSHSEWSEAWEKRYGAFSRDSSADENRLLRSVVSDGGESSRHRLKRRRSNST